MFLLKSEIDDTVELDEDPGVYPSGAGSAPLRTKKYNVYNGNIEIDMTDEIGNDFDEKDFVSLGIELTQIDGRWIIKLSYEAETARD